MSISSVNSPSPTPTPTTTTSLPSASQIISAAGIGLGSTFPVSQVLAGLMEVESIPLTQLQNQVAGVNTEISAYGTLSSALATFQASVEQLTLPTQYEVYTATSSTSSVVTAAAVAGATVGGYTIDVSQLAQAQTLAAAGQASTSTNLATDTGNATVTFTFGTTTGTGASSSFTPNTAQASGSITVNSSDDTLSGLETAINNANLGVTASIVNNGSGTPYQLVLTGTATGANEGFQVAVTGDSNIASILTYPPSGSSGGLSQVSTAQDAKLTANGLALDSSTNTNTSLPGIVLQLASTGTSTVTVAANGSAIETNIDNFVQAYNTLQTSIKSLTQYNSAGGTNGPLLGDPTTAQIQTQLQQILATSLPGTGGGLSNLSQVGITLNSDGTLSVDNTTLVQQITTNGSQFAGLFGTAGFSTSDDVSYTIGTAATQPGSYAVNITQAATQGTSVGSTALAASTVLASDTNLTVTVGGTAANITIPAGTYTQSQLVTALQTAINTNPAIQSAGQAVNVTQNNGILSIASTTYGKTSSVDVTGDGVATLFGTVTDTLGQDVEGTIGGAIATGSGQTLTAASGPATGLQLQVTATTTGAQGVVNYSQGYAAQLNSIVTAATTATTGSIASATTLLNTQVSALQTQETTLQQYISQVQAQYQTEFTALDATLSQLQSTSAFLTDTFNPTTSS